MANQGTVFFQLRPGEKRDYFKIIKFKTMNDKRTRKFAFDASRLTKIGSFVRKTP
jgi:lipopolysaccharide/colanic/teichoic acid biosynthesis glycosyltransferase